ncbi:structural protein VP8 [Sulfolobus polyhedral virus 1]|uniref:Structural protein VP8 n=1 Tax=Sulfolobus polyhedral virus 1 TaxID=1982658 RepID=A0A1W6I170_SPV1|nr:structural protein VP8 [Sulfolobus polyhedral virus 1]ARM37807.1 structural protein VP8 [Sulfolobus polyhedral virus 1]
MANAQYQVKLSSAISSGVPLFLQLNLNGIISDPTKLPYLEFCADYYCKSPINAYIENFSVTTGTSGPVYDFSQTVIWVSSPGTNTVYLALLSSPSPYTGISNMINFTLGAFGVSALTQPDNGSSIFPYYQSFAGLSALPSGYNIIYAGGSNSFTFGPYAMIIGNANADNGFYTSFTVSPGYAVDFGLALPLPGTSNISGFGLGTANSTSSYFINSSGGFSVGSSSAGAGMGILSNGTLGLYVGTTAYSTLAYETSSGSSPAQTYSIAYDSSKTYFNVYSPYGLTNSYTANASPNTNLPITVGTQGSPNTSGGAITVIFIRYRQYVQQPSIISFGTAQPPPPPTPPSTPLSYDFITPLLPNSPLKPSYSSNKINNPELHNNNYIANYIKLLALLIYNYYHS